MISEINDKFEIVRKYIKEFAAEKPIDIYNGFMTFIFPPIETEGGNYPSFETTVLGIKINFVRVGTGPAIVFIHGLANNWEGWIPTIQYLKQDYTLYLLDLPGFGDSGELTHYSIDIASNFVHEFIQNELDKKPVALIGASMGSIVVGDLVAKYPDDTKSVVLIGPIIKNNNKEILARTIRYSLWAVQHIALSEAFLKKIVETRIGAYLAAKYINMHKFNQHIVDTYNLIGKKKMRKEAYTQMAISSAGYNLKSTIETIKLPTLLLYGQEDKLSSPNYARKNVLPKNKLIEIIEIPEAGHVVSMEKPRDVSMKIKKFLGKKPVVSGAGQLS